MSTRKAKTKINKHPRVSPSDIIYERPSNDTLAHIGEIVMLFARLDNLFSFAIFKLSDIALVEGSVLLGKMEISSKLEKLGQLVAISQDADSIKKFNEIRNLISEISRLKIRQRMVYTLEHIIETPCSVGQKY